jgi:hypothetical protein
VARQVSIKAAYGLWVTGAEANAIRRVLSGCPDEKALDSPFTPPAAGTPATATYETCDAARAAGAAPVRLGDPGYGRHLDRDGDGIGCQ